MIRPQGRRGEVLAEILTDFPERFAQMREVYVRRSLAGVPLPTIIEEAWLHKGRVVLKLAKVDSISTRSCCAAPKFSFHSTRALALKMTLPISAI